jgi:hypothetical protein
VAAAMNKIVQPVYNSVELRLRLRLCLCLRLRLCHFLSSKWSSNCGTLQSHKETSCNTWRCRTAVFARNAVFTKLNSVKTKTTTTTTTTKSTSKTI